MINDQNQASSNLSPGPGENGKSHDKMLEQSPPRKRRLMDLKGLMKLSDCKIGEVFGYKNKVFMKVVFRPIFKSFYHKRQLNHIVQTNVSDDSINSDF
jgi:hypothetical protein